MSEYSTDRASQPRDNAVASGSDSAPGHVRLTKSRRGTRAAGLALGALAITSGVSGVLDFSTATTNGPNVSVGRLAITLTANHGFKLDTCTAGNSGIAQGDNTNSGNSSNIDSSDGTGANNGDTASDPVATSNSNTAVGVDIQEVPANIIAGDLATENLDTAPADIDAEMGNNNNNNNAPPPIGIMWPDGFPRWANLPPFDPHDPDDN
ncbi:hypothetical protein LAUMK42_05190 [Mycobacterium persicum]|uniref:Uncharacterized protein n=2 Tax=Mycobacterium persicum TaxID=1487726 RepID=A0AB38V008_9MYCO|nr:hypothetical protein B1T49_12620 [Mycobacterium persicum]VAZ86345.1 hypothetical protein LAUMK42_05190 [Mycobacterium persicum]